MTVAETEAQLRTRIAELEAQLADQITIPALPEEHDGHTITWERWEAAPRIIAHVPNGCEECGHEGPLLLNFGMAGPGRPTKRFRAVRCRACQEMTVYRVEPEPYGPPRMRYIEVGYHPPREHASGHRAGQQSNEAPGE